MVDSDDSTNYDLKSYTLTVEDEESEDSDSEPVITSFSPASGEQGDTVYIYGTNLAGATAVKFGGKNAASFTVNSSTKITAVVGSGSSGVITVTTSAGTDTSSGSFTYISGGAIKISVSPVSQTVSAGESFDIELLINTGSMVSRGANLEFSFNSDLLSAQVGKKEILIVPGLKIIIVRL